ncbi:MAG: right-handed parallel beta-helix repeat-containing protein [Treponema sp.]|jgi:hypothetical protein|nr:right-handed parallel beta-helix repeat-containing protein [Treponema sp.]
MKKTALILAFSVIAGSAVLAQQTIYVSAKGSRDNSGMSEAEPTDFSKAITQVMTGAAKKITIIGAVDVNSSGMRKDIGCVFDIVDSVGDVKRGKALDEIMITGKPGASGTERAVLSAKGSGNTAVWVRNCKVRFEHIDISGAEGGYGYGLYILKDAQATLGPGAAVRNNVNAGAYVAEGGSCVIDGGEIVNNTNIGAYVKGVLNLVSGSIKDNSSSSGGGGVYIAEGGRFTMSGGTITGNKTAVLEPYSGGGVYVAEGGNFTMSGGTITGNNSRGAGGGVFIEIGGGFEQNGGTVTRNTGQGAASNVYRDRAPRW